MNDRGTAFKMEHSCQLEVTEQAAKKRDSTTGCTKDEGKAVFVLRTMYVSLIILDHLNIFMCA